jgi:N-acetylmuramoyl-L-alanine amidase
MQVFLSAASNPSRAISIIKYAGIDYVAVSELSSIIGSKQKFDIITRRCELQLEDHHAYFAEDIAALIVDGELYIMSAPVLRFDDLIGIPADGALYVLKRFDPESGWKHGGEFIITAEKTSNIDASSDKKEQFIISFIVIDAGHGGKDPGAIAAGILEKDITLLIADSLKRNIQKRLKSIKVIMTRNGDRFIELSRRADIANRRIGKNCNGIFISIHINAALSGRISGFETYFLSQNPSNEESRTTAALENNSIMFEGKGGSRREYSDIDHIEAMMLTTQIQRESSNLADMIQKSMSRTVSGIKSRGVRKADFYVLRGVLMPAVLIEVGYITNPGDRKRLKAKEIQANLADGIADGIERFINSYGNTN